MVTAARLSFGRRPRRPVTRPEIRIGDWWMSGIAPWGDLRTSTRLVGDWQASWQIVRHPRRRLLRHPALVAGARVTVMLGPEPVWTGSLVEPDWDSGELTALGVARQADTALCLTAGGSMTTKPNVAIDQAISRGAWDVVRGHDFGSTAIGEADGAGSLKYVAQLLDAWAEDDDNPDRWYVDTRRVLRAATTDESNPQWFITPGVGELGVAGTERVDRVFLRYYDSTDSNNLKTASYPASTPAGGVERGVDATVLGPITPTQAGKRAEGIWRKMKGKPGWTNGLTLLPGQIATPGGVPVHPALVRAGGAARLLGAPDPRGLAHHLDVVTGDTELEWDALRLQVNPVGLADRTFEAVLEDAIPGAVAL